MPKGRPAKRSRGSCWQVVSLQKPGIGTPGPPHSPPPQRNIYEGLSIGKGRGRDPSREPGLERLRRARTARRVLASSKFPSGGRVARSTGRKDRRNSGDTSTERSWHGLPGSAFGSELARFPSARGAATFCRPRTPTPWYELRADVGSIHVGVTDGEPTQVGACSLVPSRLQYAMATKCLPVCENCGSPRLVKRCFGG